MYVGAGTAVYGTTSIPRPARARPGDVLVICAFTDHTAAFPLVWPSDWVTLGANIQLTSDSCNCNVAWKVYEETDPATYTVSNGMTYGRAVCLAFRHVRPAPVWARKHRSNNMASPWINPMAALHAAEWSDALTFVVSDPNGSTVGRVQELPGWTPAQRFQAQYYHAVVGVRGPVFGTLGPHGGIGTLTSCVSQSAAWTIAFPRVETPILLRPHAAEAYTRTLVPDAVLANAGWAASAGTVPDALAASGGASISNSLQGARVRVSLA